MRHYRRSAPGPKRGNNANVLQFRVSSLQISVLALAFRPCRQLSFHHLTIGMTRAPDGIIVHVMVASLIISQWRHWKLGNKAGYGMAELVDKCKAGYFVAL